jgi:hypothetical protein
LIEKEDEENAIACGVSNTCGWTGRGGNGKRDTGNGKWETGNGKRETGTGKRETGNREQKTGNRI